LQDILFEAGVSPKRKTALLTEEERIRLYRAVRNTIAAMTQQGGRDGWTDLFGNPGGYVRKMKTEREVCPACHAPLAKEAYLGGKVIYCPNCQK
jgi:formamidopyrimidine-DNA glycosylase